VPCGAARCSDRCAKGGRYKDRPEALPDEQKSLCARYGRGDHLRIPEFAFEKWADATPVEQFAAMRCVLYQCCEGKVPNSQLYDALNHAAGELAQPIVQDLPEFDNASWGD
jgi:hypothetical protein